MTTQIVLRLPSTSTGSIPDPSIFTPPPLSFLQGTWHVTHSTLPMWKQSRNVTITYTPLESTRKGDKSSKMISTRDNQRSLSRLLDVVSYQTLKSRKVKTVRGVDTANSPSQEAWNWRGKGFLALATSRWEVLGYGREEKAGQGNQWVVTYFAKTLFTPGGVDVYSRSEEGLAEKTVESIMNALDALPDLALKELAGSLFKLDQDER